MHYGVFDQKFVHAHVVKTDKIYLNAPILGHFKGCGYNLRATFNGVGTVYGTLRFVDQYFDIMPEMAKFAVSMLNLSLHNVFWLSLAELD